MAKWGKCDFKQFEKLQNKLQQLEKIDRDKFCQDMIKELAARLLAKVIKRTPVGEYEPSSGVLGGTLRRGWTAQSEREAELTAVFGGGNSVKSYVDSIQVTKTGDMYQIEIINPVHYASYVEYGHRTRDHKGWVEGRFMLTISEQELDAQAPAILERKLEKILGGLFNGE
jgi:hypothetical protein